MVAGSLPRGYVEAIGHFGKGTDVPCCVKRVDRIRGAGQIFIKKLIQYDWRLYNLNHRSGPRPVGWKKQLPKVIYVCFEWLICDATR